MNSLKVSNWTFCILCHWAACS